MTINCKGQIIDLTTPKIMGILNITPNSFYDGGKYSLEKNAISKVDKIVGPGNLYVALAKKTVFGDVGIDNIAGPSEVIIIADSSNNPDWVAMDLFSQAEHDEQAQAILLTDDLDLAQKVQICIEKFLKELPRSKIATSSWNDFGSIILLENIDEAINTLSKNVFVHVSASHDGSYLVKASDWQVLADALSEIAAAKGVRLKVQVDPSRV